MIHENFDQFGHALDDGQEIWISLCSCGKAFYDSDSATAYEMWEEHEAAY